jgi:hypothetical protein
MADRPLGVSSKRAFGQLVCVGDRSRAGSCDLDRRWRAVRRQRRAWAPRSATVHAKADRFQPVCKISPTVLPGELQLGPRAGRTSAAILTLAARSLCAIYASLWPIAAYEGYISLAKNSQDVAGLKAGLSAMVRYLNTLRVRPMGPLQARAARPHSGRSRISQ